MEVVASYSAMVGMLHKISCPSCPLTTTSTTSAVSTKLPVAEYSRPLSSSASIELPDIASSSGHAHSQIYPPTHSFPLPTDALMRCCVVAPVDVLDSYLGPPSAANPPYPANTSHPTPTPRTAPTFELPRALPKVSITTPSCLVQSLMNIEWLPIPQL